MKRTIPISLVIVLACSLILGGCAKQAPTPPQPPIKIGVMYPLSGPIAMTGDLLVKGALFGFEEAGYEVAGRKIEVIVEDSGGIPDMAVDKARKLVEHDKVCMIIGPLISSTKIAVGAYMSQARVPHLNTQQAPLVMTQYGWSFMLGSEPQHSCPMGFYAYDEMGLRTVTVMTEDTVAGHGFLGAFTDAFKSRGGQVIQEQYPPFPCNDFSSYLAALKDADAVAAWFHAADAIRFLTQFHEYGIRDRMPLVAAFFGSFFQPFILHELPPEAADAMIGEYAPTGWTPLIETDLSRQFVEAWKNKYQRLPEDVQSSSYLGVQVALRALEATGGDATPEKLRQAIMALEFETLEGPIRFDPETRIAIKNTYIGKIDKVGQQYVLVPVYTYEDVPPRGY